MIEEETSINSNNHQKILHDIVSNNISGDNKASLENKISNDLDNYLMYDGESLINLPIEILYNIFSNSPNLTRHNDAYELIVHRKQSSNKYILLKFLDAKKLKPEYVGESIELYEQRNFFVPRNTFSMLLKKSQKDQEKIKLIAFLLFSLILLCSIYNFYHLNATIQKKDFIINSLYHKINNQLQTNTDKVNEFISTESTKINNQMQFIQNQKKLIVGSLFFSTRNEERLPGALKCNGQSVSTSEFPEFVEQYLKTNLIATISLKRWEQIKNTTNNVGFFGYDQNGGIFKTPYIPSGSFLTNANVDMVNGNYITQGNYLPDQIVNIFGEFNFAGGGQGHSEVWYANGVFQNCCLQKITHPRASDNSFNTPRGVIFNASRVVTTGDRVMPRSIFHNLYVVVID